MGSRRGAEDAESLFTSLRPLCEIIVARLCQAEHEGLGGHHAEEHGEGVYRGVGHGRLVVAGGVVGIGQGGRVGVAARHKAHDGEQVDFVVPAGYAAHHYQGHEGDYEAPYHPPHAGGVEHRCGEVLAGGYAHAGQEEAYAQLAQQQRRRRRGVGHQLGLVAEAGQEYGHHQRAAGEAELHAEAYVDRAQDDAQDDAHEDGDEVGLVEALHGVAQARGQAVDVLQVAHHGEAVAHLEAQVGRGQEVDAGAVHAGAVELVAVVEAERAQGYAVVFALGHHYAAREHGRGGRLPVHLHLGTYHGLEAVGVVGRAYDQELVADVDVGRRLGYHHLAVGAHQARHHEVGLHHVVELEEGLAVDQGVGHLAAQQKGLELRVFLFFFDLLYLVVHLHAEYPLDDEHGQDDAHHAQGVGGGIAAGHEVGLLGTVGHYAHGLLRGGETGGVGHGAAHNAHQGRDVLHVAEEIDAEHYGHVEHNHEHRQEVEPHAAFLERREEARAHLEADGEDEEDEAELAHEFKHVAVDGVAEMPHQDTHEKHESDAERHSGHLHFADIYTGGNDEGIEHERGCYSGVAGQEKI